jgi:FtsP/CotA-like multicopper oxidase with cupredoxin domain
MTWTSVSRGGGVAAALMMLGCGSDADAGPPPSQPPGWDDEVRLTTPQDLNPDPHVLELNIEARVTDLEILPGLTTPAWTYNGALPGPLIRAKKGARLVVHFKNSLPEPTTIHWHGLRIPAAMDGVPDHSQAAVEPGATFDYDFVLPDAGTYWYHPHFASAGQVGDGLYGALIVEDTVEPEELGDETVLVFSDIGVNDDGSLYPRDTGGELGTLFGREGNVHLVNGKVRPTLHVRAGLRQRWRLINAAKSRFEQLELPGNTFIRIGGEGGFIEAPEAQSRLVLAPGQRADVLVEPTLPQEHAAERRLPLRWIAYDRGFGTDYNRPDEELLELRFATGSDGRSAALPSLSRDIAPPLLEGATPVDISLTLGTTVEGGVAMGINGVPAWEAGHLLARLGEHQLWTVRNTFDWDHPFHLHGFFFQVVDVDGVAPAVREWRDTVNVPVGGTLRFAVEFDERPGMWMFHCHVLDHADIGMMGTVHVQ